MDESKVAVPVFDADDGLIILTPANLRAASDEGLQQLIDWCGSIQAHALKPRTCPFCGIGV